MKPLSARNELREKWPRRVARRLRDWLDGYLGDIDRPDEFAGGEDVPEAPPLPENAFLDSAGGPPADWLDRVRKGAPQLLVQPSEGGVPWQSAAQASSDRMPEWVAPEADRGILKPVADTRVVPEQRKRHGFRNPELQKKQRRHANNPWFCGCWTLFSRRGKKRLRRARHLRKRGEMRRSDRKPRNWRKRGSHLKLVCLQKNLVIPPRQTNPFLLDRAIPIRLLPTFHR